MGSMGTEDQTCNTEIAEQNIGGYSGVAVGKTEIWLHFVSAMHSGFSDTL